MHAPHRPMVLVILDGWGYSEQTEYNAIHSAHKPFWDDLWALYPHILLRCSGVDVGLPEGQMGNSEVGHMHIGAGRIVDQEYSRISRAIENHSFFQIQSLKQAFDTAREKDKAVHVMGLLSPGGVHSHEDHILAAIKMAAHHGVRRIYLHAFLDGRDTPPTSAAESLQRAHHLFQELGRGHIASMIGRYYAMDRNQRWERTCSAYRLIGEGHADYEFSDPFIALDMAYSRNETDEFVRATAITPRGKEKVRVEHGDVVVFMNYRADRARQLTEAFIEREFDEFPREHFPETSAFVTLTSYSDDFDVPVAFPPERLRNVFGEYIAKRGLRQLRIAETEKYAHVTFFFNGGEERVFEGEDRILVPSPHVATYDEKPEMSAYQVTDRLVESIHSGKYDAIICNFANADMVGHTGSFEATQKAIEVIDRCIGRIVAAVQAVDGELLITADHGNAEQMRSAATKMKRGQPHTAHTTNHVPLLYVGRQGELAISGTLADVAPTMLYLMDIEIPKEMTGKPLVQLEPHSQYELNVKSIGRRRLARVMR